MASLRGEGWIVTMTDNPTPCPLCHQPSDGQCVGTNCPVGAALPGEPVAWRVKDFADGWILCATEKQARREARDCGNLVQPLYALPVAPSLDAGVK